MGDKPYVILIRGFPIIVPAGKTLYSAVLGGPELPKIVGAAILYLEAFLVPDWDGKLSRMQVTWMENDVTPEMAEEGKP